MPQVSGAARVVRLEEARARRQDVESKVAYSQSHARAHRSVWQSTSKRIVRDDYDLIFAEALKNFEDIEAQRVQRIEAQVNAAVALLPGTDEAYDDEFVAPSTSAIVVAKDLLRRVLDASTTLFRTEGLPAPDFEPTARGGVDLHWRTARAELLLAVPAEPASPITFYGDVVGTASTIKGSLSMDERVRFLAEWLSDHL